MANTTLSPNMNLPVPTVSQDPGPDWANNINSCLSILDQHNHASGSGVAITQSGISLTPSGTSLDSLTFNSSNAYALRSVRFTAQGAPLALSTDVGCLYEAGVDLYFNDGAGNQIRLTSGGSIVGTAGSISGLPSGTASASYGGGTFVWQSATSTAANMDGGSFIFRQTTANAKGITVSSPNSLAADYPISWFTGLPASQSLVTIDASGNLAAPSTAAIITLLDVVTITGTQTVTGTKTFTSAILTSPTITSPTINGTTTLGSTPILNATSDLVIQRAGTTYLTFTVIGNDCLQLGPVTSFVSGGASLGDPVASAGFIRMSKTNSLQWLNNAGSGNNVLRITSDRLTYNADNIPTDSSVDTFTNKTIAAGSNTITGLTNANLSGSAGITGANIASATITGSNIASATVTGSNIASATITGSNIAATTITASNIANNTITTSQISNSAGITGTQIASATITGSNIASSTITSSNISAPLSIAVGGTGTTSITSGGTGGSSSPTISGGTYTPTITSAVNFNVGPSAGGSQWIRIGNIVTVSGIVTVNPFSGATCTLNLSTPTSSNFSSSENASGVATPIGGNNGTSGWSGSIVATTTPNEVQLKIITVGTTASTQLTYVYTYQVV